MSQNTNTTKQYDLEDRTLKFTQRVIAFVKKIPANMPNSEISRQLVRAAGSVGANYIEANESLSKKDFVMRVKISKKEAKESRYWLTLSEVSEKDLVSIAEKDALIKEDTELMLIFGAIINKTV